jgi:hypothetical protein
MRVLVRGQYCESEFPPFSASANSSQAAQAAIAMISLTYGFDPDYSSVLLSQGNVSIPDMGHFYPQGNDTIRNPTASDEEYTAHQ